MASNILCRSSFARLESAQWSTSANKAARALTTLGSTPFSSSGSAKSISTSSGMSASSDLDRCVKRSNPDGVNWNAKALVRSLRNKVHTTQNASGCRAAANRVNMKAPAGVTDADADADADANAAAEDDEDDDDEDDDDDDEDEDD